MSDICRRKQELQLKIIRFIVFICNLFLCLLKKTIETLSECAIVLLVIMGIVLVLTET